MKSVKTIRGAICRRSCAALLIGLAGLSLPAAADVYKQVRPDGSVIYTDTPVRGIKAQKLPQLTEGLSTRVEKPAQRTQVPSAPPVAIFNGVQLPQLPPLPEAPGGRAFAALQPPAPRADTGAEDRSRAVAQAEAALAKAVQAQKDGVEPQDGDRTGTAHGGSRLNQGYEKRQQDLADAVASARQALKDAQGR